MSSDLPLSIVVPVFKEQATIARTLGELKRKVDVPHRVLVVYDFEEDPTLPVVRGLMPEHPNVVLLRNNLGKGVLNAIKKGFSACSHGAVLVTMADLSDDLSQVGQMHRLICEGYDVVAGSRYSPGGAQHGGGLIKSALSRLAGRSLAALTTLPTRDATNAFRMYSASFLEQIEIESRGGFELSLELTVKAWAYGFRVAEVPTVWRDRADGESNFQMRAWLPNYLHWYMAALGHHYLGRPLGSGIKR